jgi:methionine synthase / methylenetetrahydrofolate reductase(NADPH)
MRLPRNAGRGGLARRRDPLPQVIAVSPGAESPSPLRQNDRTALAVRFLAEPSLRTESPAGGREPGRDRRLASPAAPPGFTTVAAVSRFLQRLETGPAIVADGGMGALISAAVPRLRCPEEANLRAPQAVVSLHVGFINAGADLIETNTFGANRRKLAANFLEDELEAINSNAVKLAREAREVTGREVFIGGSIGPLGEVAASRVRREIFAEQATVLEGRGADLFMVETFYDLEELTDAVEAIRAVSSLPIVALLTFDEGAETLAGVRADEAAERLSELDLAAYGANHGAGLLVALEALEQMTGDGRRLAALPNIGLASLAGGRVIYPHATPEYFAEFAAHARDLGARIIGGCCGTTPTEIAAIRAALEEERRPRAQLDFSGRELVVSLGEEHRETGLARALREREWVVSVQLDPPLGGSNRGLIEVAQALKESGKVGFLDINDNAAARVGIHALMTAVAIEHECGIETIPHLTPRDSTIMGLQAVLLGAHAAGVRNVLAVTGDPPEIGDYPGSRGVFEVDAIGLTEMVARLNRGEDFNGRAIDAPTDFFVGVAVNPTADDLELELERFHRKVEAGARFAMTQLVFDVEFLDRFLDRLGGTWPIPVLVGIWPLRSHQLALRLHNELPGVLVPEPVQEAMRKAGTDAPAVGMRIARELYEASRGRAAGVYVTASYRQPLSVLDLLT